MWGVEEAVQALLGALWVGMIGALVMFIYNYNEFYRKGVIEKNKSYYLT